MRLTPTSTADKKASTLIIAMFAIGGSEQKKALAKLKN